MPEGDTIHLLARRMHAALAGRLLTASDFRVPRLATVDLSGRTVREALSRGKHLLLRVEGGLTVHSHLRMDGAWSVQPAGERPRGGPAWQIRAVLATDAYVAYGYRLPVLELLPTDREEEAVGHLGPDLLGPDWDVAEAVRRLSREPGRPLGEALLDQRNLAGIGNVYKSELCYLAGVTPWSPVGALAARDGLPRLAELAHRLLYANRARHGHVTTGDARPDRRHWVYGRAGRPCRRCGTAVRTAEQGPAPEARVTFWCPRCQRGPGPEGPGPEGREPGGPGATGDGRRG
ncbi:Fpg/Nei family DNA glycosylase [Allostreptomyces psammosilenae]|uniref:DNA-(apurinic or apyrimidinic site) lyase n=1 Tax=Allostreptomyces psammosilenae TaxID=1892865 RepID=A0A852ZNL6_9ACTN|nr:Fpg/Nei family DNA glycosylase [Allostreptomyces psammosilenae]NYI03067.1 endonuclease-8 [Allostreptomyces psammosilenae]